MDEDRIVFKLLSKDMVDRLVRTGDITLPKKKVDVPKDKRWNTKILASKLLQGLMNGDDVPTIAKSLTSVIGLNSASTIRNARTMVTGAENLGRQESYERLSEQGLIMKKVWMATQDDRTRQSHLEMDGEEVDIDDLFSNGLEYPGDPKGEPSEVWNCRCTMRTRIVGFREDDGNVSMLIGGDEWQRFQQRSR